MKPVLVRVAVIETALLLLPLVGAQAQIFSSFVQDQIAIVPDRFYVTLGTKLEHYYFNGFNLPPTARIAWAASDRIMFWAAISGAQRTPSVGEATIRQNETVLPGADNLPILINVFGNPEQRNERLIATEAGYRGAVSDRLSTGPRVEGDSPRQQAQLRSQVNLPWRLQWTTPAFFVGRLASQKIPSYTRLDTNLAWQAWERVSPGIGGQNLLREVYQEYAGPDLTELPSLIPCSAYVRLAWRF